MNAPIAVRRIGALSLATLLCATVAFSEETKPAEKLGIGSKAPELQVSVIKGEPVRLADGKGKHVYIVEFWATWCGPCKYSIPHLTEIQKKYRDKGLIVVGISAEKAPIVKPWVEKQGDTMNYTVAVDDAQKTYRAYMEPFNVAGIPWAFVVDQEGLLVWTGHPMDPFLEELVSALLDDGITEDPTEATPRQAAQSGSEAKTP